MYTKEDILEYWGRKACGKDETGTSIWKTEEFKSELTSKKIEVAKSDNPQDFIDFAYYMISKKKLHPFTHEEQLKDLPDDLSVLQHTSIDNLTHPFWSFCFDKALKEYKPHSSTMVIASCSNLKPYKNNPNYKFLIKRQEEGYCDLFINSVMLWPIEYTDWLYARVYDLLECDDSIEGYNEVSANIKYERIIKYIEYFGFQKLIMWIKPDNMYKILNERLKTYCKDHNIEYVEILSEDAEEQLTQKFKNKGLVYLRHWYQPELQHKFDLLINYPNPVQLKTEEEIKKEAEMRAWKKKQRKLKQKAGKFDFSK